MVTIHYTSITGISLSPSYSQFGINMHFGSCGFWHSILRFWQAAGSETVHPLRRILCLYFIYTNTLPSVAEVFNTGQFITELKNFILLATRKNELCSVSHKIIDRILQHLLLHFFLLNCDWLTEYFPASKQVLTPLPCGEAGQVVATLIQEHGCRVVLRWRLG